MKTKDVLQMIISASLLIVSLLSLVVSLVVAITK